MPDTKITALTAISTVDPAADPLVIVDVSDTSMAASGTTKKSTINQLLGAGGTATLASATITGNLTVDTNTLFVDSASNNVGLGTVSPSGASGRTLEIYGGAGQSRIALKNDATGSASTDGSQIALVGSQLVIQNREASEITFETNNSERFRLDASGNAGLGVIPQSWGSNWKALDLLGGGRLYTLSSTGTHGLCFNGYNNNTNWLYQFSTAASRFELQNNGNFSWFTAPSGTAGNAITFTQAMTLDASSNLLIGTTDASSTSGAGFKIIGSGLGPYVVNAATTNSALAYTMYSTGAAAYRFYVGWGGTVFATNTTISAISDARFKENVQDIDVGLGAILALKPRKFDWKEGKGKNIKGDRGFIAQEFEQVFPQLVDEWKDAAPEGEAPYKSVRQDLIPVLVKAIQELTARVQTLETR